MKIVEFYKMPKGTVFVTDEELTSKNFNRRVKIDNKIYVVTGVATEDRYTFVIQENISEVKNKEIEFVK